MRFLASHRLALATGKSHSLSSVDNFRVITIVIIVITAGAVVVDVCTTWTWGTVLAIVVTWSCASHLSYDRSTTDRLEKLVQLLTGCVTFPWCRITCCVRLWLLLRWWWLRCFLLGRCDANDRSWSVLLTIMRFVASHRLALATDMSRSLSSVDNFRVITIVIIVITAGAVIVDVCMSWTWGTGLAIVVTWSCAKHLSNDRITTNSFEKCVRLLMGVTFLWCRITLWLLLLLLLW
jgi:hypothetical protein